MNEPRNPFQRRQFNGFEILPGLGPRGLSDMFSGMQNPVYIKPPWMPDAYYSYLVGLNTSDRNTSDREKINFVAKVWRLQNVPVTVINLDKPMDENVDTNVSKLTPAIPTIPAIPTTTQAPHKAKKSRRDI